MAHGPRYIYIYIRARASASYFILSPREKFELLELEFSEFRIQQDSRLCKGRFVIEETDKNSRSRLFWIF